MKLLDRCFLHIGTEKTGTTTIQSFLSKNRERLLSQGYIYPLTAGEVNHMALTAYALEDSKIDDVRLECGVEQPKAVSPFRDTLRASLDKEIFSSSAHAIVFSNEHLSSRLKTVDEVRRVKDICDRYARETNVIIYLRNQVDFLTSWYATSIKSGNTHAFPYPLGSALSNLMNYHALLELWQQIFGKEQLVVRRYESQDFLNGDLLADFAAQIGFDIAEFEKVERHNESLDRHGIAFLREFNKYVPRIVNRRFNPLRGRVVAFLEQSKSGDRLLLSQEIASAIERKFRQSNEMVSLDYFDGRYKPLFSPPKSVATDGQDSSTDLDAELAVEIATRLWIAQQRRILRLEKLKNI